MRNKNSGLFEMGFQSPELQPIIQIVFAKLDITRQDL
jgi:hypothetical protein